MRHHKAKGTDESKTDGEDDGKKKEETDTDSK